jgi:hypothetical protein
MAVDEHMDAARSQNNQAFDKLTLAHQLGAVPAFLPQADTPDGAHVARFEIKHQFSLKRLLVSA